MAWLALLKVGIQLPEASGGSRQQLLPGENRGAKSSVKTSAFVGALTALCVMALHPNAKAVGRALPDGPPATWAVSQPPTPEYPSRTPEAIAVDPAGTRVFVASLALHQTTDWARSDFEIHAYDAATGTQLWRVGPGGPDATHDHLWDAAVSPDGQTLFVAGDSSDPIQGWIVSRVAAYRTSDGARLWLSRDRGPNWKGTTARAVVVSPDGSSVFVTGVVGLSSNDFMLLAYDAADGHRRWAARFDAEGGDDTAVDLAVDPGGGSVYVTGPSTTIDPSFGINYDYRTVAFDVADGRIRWIARYDSGGGRNDRSSRLVVVPDGRTVVVSGSSNKYDGPTPDFDDDVATVAYDAASGQELWVHTYDDGASENSTNRSTGLATTPDGKAIVVSSSGWTQPSLAQAVVFAYAPRTGAEVWTVAVGEEAWWVDTRGIVASPVRDTVYLVGGYGELGHEEVCAVALDVRAGQVQWMTRYTPPTNDSSVAVAGAVSSDGGSMFLLGLVSRPFSTESPVTLAYPLN
jgi:outer membrane protein assembly factor BamB